MIRYCASGATIIAFFFLLIDKLLELAAKLPIERPAPPDLLPSRGGSIENLRNGCYAFFLFEAGYLSYLPIFIFLETLVGIFLTISFSYM